MSESDVLTPGQVIKPAVDEETAREIVESRYGIQVKHIFELNAYDDRNFKIIAKDQDNQNPYISEISKNGYVLKIVNSLDSMKIDLIEAQNELLIFLNQRGIKCPLPQKQKDGSYFNIETFGQLEKKRHVIRLFLYRNGDILSKIPFPNFLLKKIGYLAAHLDNILLDFHHPAYDCNTTLWALTATPYLRDFMFAIEDQSDKNIIEDIISQFEERVLEKINCFDRGIIHGDLTADNIVVTKDEDDVEAVIDFGESHKDCLYFELAICLCYMLIYSQNIEAVKDVIKGYQTRRHLTSLEKQVLKLTVCARFAQTIVLGAYSYKNEPNNYYLINEQGTKWTMLKKLWPIEEEEIMDLWQLK